jgi:hypothetical protein
MSTRSKARRHHGRHTPYRRAGVREVEPVVDATSMAYWQARIEKPLFVYFIQSEDGGPVKIGQAVNPAKRLAELQCGNPAELVIRAVVLAGVETEKVIHGSWRSSAHVRGEWYGQGFEQALISLAHAAAERQVYLHCEGADLRRIVHLAGTMLAYPDVVTQEVAS